MARQGRAAGLPASPPAALSPQTSLPAPRRRAGAPLGAHSTSSSFSSDLGHSRSNSGTGSAQAGDDDIDFDWDAAERELSADPPSWGFLLSPPQPPTQHKRSTSAHSPSNSISSTPSLAVAADRERQQVKEEVLNHLIGLQALPEYSPPPRNTPTLAPSSSSSSAKPPTGLETVDLSHRKIANIDKDVIDVLKAGFVERCVPFLSVLSFFAYDAQYLFRLALGYNHLTSLPAEFAQLGTSLRYLNVRVNNISHFPPAVRVHLPICVSSSF
jgi:hypothetical protein